MGRSNSRSHGARARGPVSSDEITSATLENLDTARLEELGGVENLAKAFQTDLKRGLQDDQIDKLRQRFGSNVLPTRQPRGFIAHLFESFEDATLIILIVSAIVSIGFGVLTGDPNELIQGCAIVIAIVIVSGVTSVQNWSKDKEFASLSAIKADRPVVVLRDGAEQEISIKDIVSGDIIFLNVGDLLPCDGVLLEGHQIQCDESDMTGESLPKRKGRFDQILWGGCKIVEGDGKMLATCVGENSQYGAIVKTLEQGEPPATPLQEKLEVLAEQIGYVGMVFGALTSVALTFMWLNEQDDWSGADYTNILGFFIVGITIVVVAVPEGLPLAVTISLAFSMRKMLRDNNLVRELKSCETMGSATCICSDKTGTLTENRMTVVEGWFFDKFTTNLGSVAVDAGPGSLDVVAACIACNATASVSWDGRPHSRPEYFGNKTEGALLWMMMRDWNMSPDDVRDDYQILYRQSFSSESKRMCTVVRDVNNPEDVYVFAKGAGEIILDACDNVQNMKGKFSKLTNDVKSNLHHHISSMARRGHRTLAIAYKKVRMNELKDASDDELARHFEDLEHSGDLCNALNVIAIVGILDPIRKEVPEAVERCMQAGIRVVMVTGDNMLTAKSIASQCGIYRSSSTRTRRGSISSQASTDDAGDLEDVRVMLGADFRELDEEERKLVAKNIQILARSSPHDKLLLVEALKSLDEVVAVTGDGTNDAPALRAAHVGLSMGLAGTEVAKEASDIIILDDNFASIVLSVRWGRAIMENIRKFLTFQLTINIVALVITFLVACTNRGSTTELPLTPVQLLWINLIMDSFAALALATEPPSEHLLERKPEGKTTPLITKVMWKNLIGHAIFQTVLLLWLTMSPKAVQWLGIDAEEMGNREHYTMVFNVFVFLQVFNMINCRKVHDEFAIFESISNSYFLEAILSVIVAMQFVIVHFGGDIAQTRPLSFVQWRQCILLGVCSIPVGYVLKLIQIDEHLEVESPRAMYRQKKSMTGGSNGHTTVSHRGDGSDEHVPESPEIKRRGSAARLRRRAART